jgi:hypothetical protein
VVHLRISLQVFFTDSPIIGGTFNSIIFAGKIGPTRHEKVTQFPLLAQTTRKEWETQGSGRDGAKG